MTILILGATGPTGLNVLKMAIDKGYQVTALVRDPSKLDFKHENLRILKGDVLEKNSVDAAVKQCQAVISALGVGNSLKSNDLMFNAVSNIIPAMEKEKCSRFIFLSAFGVGPTFKDANFFQKMAYRIFLSDIYRDKIKADETIRASNLEYTIVCPVKLTHGPFTGNYKAAEKLPMKGFPGISRADVAHFMVSQVIEKNFLRKTVVLGP